MKQQKFYLRIQYDQHSHQMVRVDSIKEFRDIIDSSKFKAYIWSVQRKATLEITADESGKYTSPKPFEIRVSEEVFEKMNKEINRKLSTVKGINFPEFNLVLNSKTSPIIRIFKS